MNKDLTLIYWFAEGDGECQYAYDIDSLEGINEILQEELKIDKGTAAEVCDLFYAAGAWDNLTDYYEDELKAAYEEDAKEAYENEKAYSKDPLGYYGMSQKDFI